MDRRTFLARVGAFGASIGLGAVAAACGAVSRSSTPSTRSSTPSTRPRTTTPVSRVHDVDGLPVADWVVEENTRHGATDWVIPRSIRGLGTPPIEGYLDHVSATKGDEITLYVNTVAPRFRASIYRIGFYGGVGARRVERSPELVGVMQKPPRVAAENMVECDWSPSWRTTVGSDWPSGSYLIKLEGSRREQRYVPFTVRDEESKAAYIIQSSVTTWQAYNPYGGYSLYGGLPDGHLADRARIVSFDRPYGHTETALDAHGSGDFLGNEFPFIYLVERHGLDVSYWTDIDLDDPSAEQLLLNHRCLVSLGHDEYWSMTMRNNVESALAKGLNVAFLGANACYRQIRLDASPLGPKREVICYKDAAEDPITATDPALATGQSWATDPIPRPESALIGVMYQSYEASGPLVVADGASWVFEGTGLANGDTIPNVIGSEFDGFEPTRPRPAGAVQILAHSPTGPATVSGPSFSDMSYYSLHSGGSGVFASGTASFVTAMWDGIGSLPGALGFGVETGRYEPITRIAMNVLSAFGHEPAGKKHPSVETWHRYYRPNTPSKGSVDVP